jgi:hypothetical protein
MKETFFKNIDSLIEYHCNNYNLKKEIINVQLTGNLLIISLPCYFTYTAILNSDKLTNINLEISEYIKNGLENLFIKPITQSDNYQMNEFEFDYWNEINN